MHGKDRLIARFRLNGFLNVLPGQIGAFLWRMPV
jgi:hypothetical protein